MNTITQDIKLDELKIKGDKSSILVDVGSYKHEIDELKEEYDKIKEKNTILVGQVCYNNLDRISK